MTASPTPLQILETMLPPLRMAAGYTRHIQSRIVAQPSKDGDNPFASALTDADLSVQTFVEVALLGSFPHIRFYGEEHQQSYNTKYFRAIDLGEEGDYLVTLDPIDGTLFYMDGFPNYLIILTVLNADDFEAVLAISPAEECYYYALRGQGTFVGHLEKGLDLARPLKIVSTNTVFLASLMTPLRPKLIDRYEVVCSSEDYSRDRVIPNTNGILKNQLGGVVLSKGQFIDGAALAFLAREAGCIVSDHRGQPLPTLDRCDNYCTPGIAIAATEQIHQDLIGALEGFER